MYHVINSHIDQVLAQISRGHVAEYDYLHANRHNLVDIDYQRRFKIFWAMNAARLSEPFCSHYFDLLKEVLVSRRDIKEIAGILNQVPTNANGKSLQFSFASKLLHMVDSRTPIYDSMVTNFFFYEEPNNKRPVEQRIGELAGFHRFLVAEYRRILDNDLLGASILKFREVLNPKTFTDEKIIDSLIWGFVSIQKGGAASRKEIVYC